ncbi:hypothetical protein BDP81DRAFT_12357 [Colletotrichum phormii]|uniref:Uncharacterized protein n=1 Tax=Colletotrichum phormii TaxID=359342 RepID=A0AAJ0ENY6_9PEZI|nr:uncharacterized protein BDP81DRAFT_12357 [Colletotrichum phormii]KAK1655923.1 hypothetical protein BDP81DRAFT_12357 [Colletotrichum phormii]
MDLSLRLQFRQFGCTSGGSRQVPLVPLFASSSPGLLEVGMRMHHSYPGHGWAPANPSLDSPVPSLRRHSPRSNAPSGAVFFNNSMVPYILRLFTSKPTSPVYFFQNIQSSASFTPLPSQSNCSCSP